jgi:hypothetical protein
MPRYTIELPTGKQLPVEDWMLTDMGIEAVQIIDDEHVVLILVLGDGTVIYDRESGKTKEDLQKAKDEYKKMTEHQQDTFRERANQIIREAVEQGKDADQAFDPEDDEPEIPYHAPEGPEPAGYA